MMGITWWNVVDDCGGAGEPTVSGLFDRQMEPKPSFHALDHLINHEWRTNLSVRTTKKGACCFRGYKGEYRISWVGADGNKVSRTFTLNRDGDSISL